MDRPPAGLDTQIEAAVRRYVNSLARRYVPVVVGAVTLALVIAFVPTVNEQDGGDVTGAGEATGAADEEVAAGGPVGSSPAATDGGGGGSGAAGGATSVGPAGRAGGASAPSVSGPAAAGTPTGGATALTGTARSGVACGPGVRQVPWSKYAPLCVPQFSGDNRGATSHGVTKDSIVVTFRKGNSTQDTAVYAAAGDAAPAPDSEFVADMQTYIDIFNRTYELYGRKVVLKAFEGHGDYIRENMGQGQPEAAADAATAHDLGAFIDATFLLKGSQPFWTALAKQKVIAVGPLGFPKSWYQRNSPYWYSVSPTGTDGINFNVNLVCRRLAGMAAENAGDPLLQAKTRSFGLITPENPEYMEVGDGIQNGLKGCGAPLAKRVSYSINVVTYQTQALNMVAQMQQAGVTTVICYCDPLIPIFLSQAADQQRYRPEWGEPYYRDPQGRLMSQTQWAHAVSNFGASPPRAQSEAYRVYKLANPRGEPRQQYYDVAYYTVLFIFNALQAAGPALTPQSLRQGISSLPRSERGDAGTWAYGPDSYSPQIDTLVGWWDPNAISNYDGKKGAWQSCEGGAWFPYADANAWGAPRTRLRCFGK